MKDRGKNTKKLIMSYECGTWAQAILKTLWWRFCSMAKAVIRN
jgi:hypothetical protein